MSENAKALSRITTALEGHKGTTGADVLGLANQILTGKDAAGRGLSFHDGSLDYNDFYVLAKAVVALCSEPEPPVVGEEIPEWLTSTIDDCQEVVHRGTARESTMAERAVVCLASRLASREQDTARWEQVASHAMRNLLRDDESLMYGHGGPRCKTADELYAAMFPALGQRQQEGAQ